MRHLLAILAALLFCAATAQAQTLKALAYNTTNGIVAYSGTNVLVFTNNLQFFDGAVIAEQLMFADGGSIYFDGTTDVTIASSYTAEQWRNALQMTWAAETAAATRTNLGIPLAALTNTSNVTMMRSLSGSTNTNHPYSGTVALTNTNAVLTFSNGILQSVQ